MHKLFVMAVLAASVLVMPSACAQLQGGEGTMLGSNAEGFDGLVADDVAKGYYTAEQGQQLQAQWDQSMQNLTESIEKAQIAVQRTESLAQSGNQMTLNQLDSLANAQGQAKLGGTPEEIEEQAKAIYNGAHMTLEVGQAQIENIAPILQSAINEISTVMNARNALIQNNPNVSPTVKHNSGREAAQIEDATKNALQSGMGKFTEKIQQAQAQMDNNKEQIINQIQDAITKQSNAQGTDPTKWTKPAKPTPPPAKTALPPNAVVVPNDPNAQGPTPNLPGTPQVYGPTPNGSVKGSGTNSKGTVPSNQPDPALSANRNNGNSGNANSNNGPGNVKASNTPGNTGPVSNKPAANNGAPSGANNNSIAAAKATNQVPVKISQVLTNPSVPKPQTPPPPPKLNQQDLNNGLNKKMNIPNLPVAQPPSNAPRNAPVDPTAIGLNNKPSNNPPGNGKAVNQNAPPSNSGKPVLMPSSNQGLGMAPQTNQNNQDEDQSQNPAQQPPSDQATGTGSSAAANAAAAAANAAASAAADASDAASSAGSAASTAAASSNSAQASSQSNQSSGTFIPTMLNNPNAESVNDPSFSAYRNNPDANPANGAPISGEVAIGSSNVNPGPLVPPNQQSAPQDAAAVADAAAAAAAAAAASAADSSAPAPASNPPASQPSMTDIEAQIAKQFKPGNMHLVEGDDGTEGVADATAGNQIPALSNLDASVEFGDTLSVATLASISQGYVVTPGQNGSSVIVAGTMQVATPSSLMTAPSMQVSTPGAMMTAPSMQVQFPSSVMTDPSMQVQFPSALMVIPSSQIMFPSDLMMSLDLQPALCGR
jgi:hypothetical protein